jgi:hypothetical protein
MDTTTNRRVRVGVDDLDTMRSREKRGTLSPDVAEFLHFIREHEAVWVDVTNAPPPAPKPNPFAQAFILFGLFGDEPEPIH